MKKKVLVLGHTGLVGSSFVDLYRNKFSFITAGRNDSDIYLDLLVKDNIKKTILNTNAEVVINFAAYTAVDEAEKQKGDLEGEVYMINTFAPGLIAKYCKESGKRFIQLSTDYVFDGEQGNRPYNEEAIVRPVDSWYVITKYQGEQEVLKMGSHAIVARISYPYSAKYKRKLDFARVILSRVQNGQTFSAISDQKIKPTNVYDIAKALTILIDSKSSGIFHIAGKYGNDFVTPYEFAKKLCKIFQLDKNLLKSITFDELSKVRVASRPKHTWLDTSKIEKLGMAFKDLDQSLSLFKKQFNTVS